MFENDAESEAVVEVSPHRATQPTQGSPASQRRRQCALASIRRFGDWQVVRGMAARQWQTPTREWPLVFDHETDLLLVVREWPDGSVTCIRRRNRKPMGGSAAVGTARTKKLIRRHISPAVACR